MADFTMDHPAVTIHHKGNMDETDGSQTPHLQFGWTHFDAVGLPYVIRNEGTMLIAVRLIEKYILCHYPNTYPKEIANKPPLVSYLLTRSEAELLTQLCHDGLNSPEIFKPSDPAVQLLEFQEFFTIVKAAYPHIRISYKRPLEPFIDHGWILVKDSMVPYVIRFKTCLLPLNVLRGAPQVLIDIQVETVPASMGEVDCLNKLCKKVGLVFIFHKNTGLVDLCDLAALCPGCRIEELDKDDPLLMLKAIGRQNKELQRHPDSIAEQGTSPLSPARNGSDEPLCQIHGAENINMSSGASTPHRLPIHTETDDQLSPFHQPGDSNLHSPHTPDDMLPPPLIPLNDLVALTPSLTAASCTPPHTQQGDKPNDIRKNLADLTRSRIHAKAIVQSSVPTSSTQSTNESGQSQYQQVEPLTRAEVEIMPMVCFGKTISCIMRGKLRAKYALVEAIVIVFFPDSDLSEFVRYLEFELSVTLYTLARHEEAAFIQFYSIPTNQLRCNQIIKLKDFVHRITWIQQRFGAIDMSQKTLGRLATHTEEPSSASSENRQQNKISSVERSTNSGQSIGTLPHSNVLQPIFDASLSPIAGGIQVQSVPSLPGGSLGPQRPVDFGILEVFDKRGKSSLDETISRLRGHKRQEDGTVVIAPTSEAYSICEKTSPIFTTSRTSKRSHRTARSTNKRKSSVAPKRCFQTDDTVDE